jgi:uncharacterized repeat protein (TIGR03803 family)
MKASSWKALVVVGLLCLATSLLSAQTLTTVADFGGGSEGTGPFGIIQANNGNFYGVTQFAGSGPYCSLAGGCGTIFEVTSTGKVTTLYNFCSQKGCADGAIANGLVQASNGNFYGTTKLRGAHYMGTIFEITPAGKFTSLYSFCAQANCPDGSNPVGRLVQGIDGALYGLTNSGGPTGCRYGCGTMFKITLSGQFTSVFDFCAKTNCVDEGRNPQQGLTVAPSGDFYGTTFGGGRPQEGIIFKITSSGSLTKLYSFYSQPNGADGWDPQAPLTLGGDGNLYGTASKGGTFKNGTLFKITPAGQYTVLYNFCSQTNCADGASPSGPIAWGSDGNLYGTAAGGGSTQYAGTAFQINPSGQYRLLYTFCSQVGCADGVTPFGLIQDTNGNFYGTTGGGGGQACSCGTVFSLSMGLEPFVEAEPSFAPVGKRVAILGNGLTGTTSVTFNGTPATFKVGSGTYILATVPAGATTGPIEVTTPSGTLSSNVAFQVLP